MTRNATGQPVEVVKNENGRVFFYNLHISTRERMGSMKSLPATKFFLRYA